MSGGSGDAVGNAEGDGEGLGVAAAFAPKSEACALDVVATVATPKAATIVRRSASRFKIPGPDFLGFGCLNEFREFRHDREGIADDREVRELRNRRLTILIDRYDCT